MSRSTRELHQFVLVFRALVVHIHSLMETIIYISYNLPNYIRMCLCASRDTT